MSNDIEFFACIGAQKAGTSWLQSYLNKSPEVFLPRIKEMHFFDTISLPENLVGDFWINKFQDKACNAVKRRNYEVARSYIDRLKIGRDPAKYKDYYQNQINRIGGDITPAYSMLSKQGYSEIKNIFPKAKIIFLMRNPAERYWSFLRMQLNKNKNYPVDRKFFEVINNDHVMLRSDYERTIRSLESVFSKSDIQYIFYEDLFGDNHDYVVGEINNFLGLHDLKSDSLELRVNASAAMEMSEDMREFAVQHFRSIYEYIFDKFSHAPSCWVEDFNKLKL